MDVTEITVTLSREERINLIRCLQGELENEDENSEWEDSYMFFLRTILLKIHP